MPVMNCAGPDCSRLISVSAIPGGNPTALAEPEHWAVQWRHCKTCHKYWCDRCWQKHPSIATQQLCPTDGKTLVGPSTDHALNLIQPKASSASLQSANAPGRVAFFIFAGIAGVHLLVWLIGRVANLGASFHQAFSGLDGLAKFIGWIFFAVWIYRATAALRASGPTLYSPGLAVGCWFIPFANFVMPMLAVRDVCKRTLSAENLWLVPVWWVSYWLTTIFTAGGPYIWRAIGSVPLIGYLPLLVGLAAYGSWAAILFLSTREPSGEAVPA